MTIAIRARGLSKRYRLGRRPSYGRLTESLDGLVKSTARLLTGRQRLEAGSIWALKDVSFDVEQGQVVGFIGRNGAGKSTLLKVLSRITEPTTGTAELRGRFASLLEIGTGFHPELTGRENIYLNGAVLGMRKREVDRKFNDIVSFSGLADFIDTPVKRYSTGMHLRLGFSVAAHLETEILAVDEVLAVGDLEFQQRCLGKMRDSASSGRTVLFVSHQMNQIRRLCTEVIWLDRGMECRSGSAGEVVNAYEAALLSQDTDQEPVPMGGAFNFEAREVSVNGQPSGHELTGEGEVTFLFRVRTRERLTNAQIGIALYSLDMSLVWAYANRGLTIPVGVHEFEYRLPGLPLRPGVYKWLVTAAADERLIASWDTAPDLSIQIPPFAHVESEWVGVLNMRCEASWRTTG